MLGELDWVVEFLAVEGGVGLFGEGDEAFDIDYEHFR